jgi:hypothetical protein
MDFPSKWRKTRHLNKLLENYLRSNYRYRKQREVIGGAIEGRLPVSSTRNE